MEMSKVEFQQELVQGIPSFLPDMPAWDDSMNHAPKRKEILTSSEKKLALRNALRYFPPALHAELAEEFAEELKLYGRIYMYRYRPTYAMRARPIEDYPAQSLQAAAIMLMIQNNLDPAVAQHPHELITYGGNGGVFQNWAQYRLTMQYLSQMTNEQTLVMYSGHPLGLFPSHEEAPRVVVTNGMMIPNYSQPDDWEKFNALGVTQYGQMTAGSYMYIGPQGIVHGTTITVMNASRMLRIQRGDNRVYATPGEGLLFVTAGLGGMSGAQPKASTIAGCVSITAEVNPKAAFKRHEQGWVDHVFTDVVTLVKTADEARKKNQAVSFAYVGNVVDLWEELLRQEVKVDLGSDQTSLHNPWAGGYYPVGMSLEEANVLMADNPEEFKSNIHMTLRRHAAAIQEHAKRGMYFFDYGNAFLLEASRAGADVLASKNSELYKRTMDGVAFAFPSYVQDILGPLCFDYGFGPFRWVCCSGKPEDLQVTDRLAEEVLTALMVDSPAEIQQQLADNIKWIQEAGKNNMVVGSQARILYADAQGRMRIAQAFNEAIREGKVGPIVLGRDHHDVSGTDSPFRETSNIYDGSRFTADMAVHNFVGDAFRGATWVSLHNGGGVGWGEVINGGFGMVLDGSDQAEVRLKRMLHWDVNNGIARRSWARNKEARFAIERAMEQEPLLKVTLAESVEDAILDRLG
jgi:urocanate hydratase